MSVVAVGDNCIDYYPKLGRWYPTGNCVDFAVNIAAMGVRTGLVSATGSDMYGDSMYALLRDKNVECTHLHRLEGNTAMAKMDLVGESGKDRLHVSFDDGVLTRLDLTDDDLRYISEFDVVHSLSNGFVNHRIPEIKAMGKTIVYDFSQNWNFAGVEKVIPCIDYGFFSYKEEDDFILGYLRDMCEKGMGTAVATLGDKGSVAFDGKKLYHCGCSPIAELVNTVGAGDSYIAGFTYAMMNGGDVESCMEKGAEVAAKIVQVFEPYEDYRPMEQN